MKKVRAENFKAIIKQIQNGLLPLSLLGLMGFTAGCNNWQKDPLDSNSPVSLADLRNQAKNQQLNPSMRPKEITKNIIVKEPKIVVREETSIDNKFIVISADSPMTFSEGKTSSFKVRARSLHPDQTVQVILKATGLPQGATFAPSKTEKDLYILSWNPTYYTVRPDESYLLLEVKFNAELIPGPTTKNPDVLRGLFWETKVPVVVFRNQELPSGLKVESLPQEVKEGDVTRFTVTATVPGIDGTAATKPRLVISYDMISHSAGNDFMELDGTRHIVADPTQKDAEYLGENKWKFTMLYDTKNISVQPQLSKDGKVMANATGTRVRLSFKVFSPSGLATPETLVQLRIAHAEKPAPEMQQPETKKSEEKATINPAPSQSSDTGTGQDGQKNEAKK